VVGAAAGTQEFVLGAQEHGDAGGGQEGLGVAFEEADYA
jgi:hypothetical protein